MQTCEYFETFRRLHCKTCSTLIAIDIQMAFGRDVRKLVQKKPQIVLKNVNNTKMFMYLIA